MSTPVLHVLAGPNGSGKSTFVAKILVPHTRLHVVNADDIAEQQWPGDELNHAYEASRFAARERERLLAARLSFITETVFSHPSKVELIDRAVVLGYQVHLHVMAIPADLSVARVNERVRRGGHQVPEEKIRERHARLWALIRAARDTADRCTIYDNTVAKPAFRVMAHYIFGEQIGDVEWPAWFSDGMRSDLSDRS